MPKLKQTRRYIDAAEYAACLSTEEDSCAYHRTPLQLGHELIDVKDTTQKNMLEFYSPFDTYHGLELGHLVREPRSVCYVYHGTYIFVGIGCLFRDATHSMTTH